MFRHIKLSTYDIIIVQKSSNGEGKFTLLGVAEFSILFYKLNLKKVQRALKNILVGTFLPLGSDLATPVLEEKTNLSARKDNFLFLIRGSV